MVHFEWILLNIFHIMDFLCLELQSLLVEAVLYCCWQELRFELSKKYLPLTCMMELSCTCTCIVLKLNIFVSDFWLIVLDYLILLCNSIIPNFRSVFITLIAFSKGSVFIIITLKKLQRLFVWAFNFNYMWPNFLLHDNLSSVL